MSEPKLRWYVKKSWQAAPGSWAVEWPRNAELVEEKTLQYLDDDGQWKELPQIQGPRPAHP